MFNFKVSIEQSNIELIVISVGLISWKKFGEKSFKFDFRYEWKSIFVSSYGVKDCCQRLSQTCLFSWVRSFWHSMENREGSKDHVDRCSRVFYPRVEFHGRGSPGVAHVKRAGMLVVSFPSRFSRARISNPPSPLNTWHEGQGILSWVCQSSIVRELEPITRSEQLPCARVTAPHGPVYF